MRDWGRTLRLGGRTVEVIGLGAEGRTASAELVRAFALSLNLAPLLQGARQRCATTCRSVHANHGLSLWLSRSFIDLQTPRSARTSHRAPLPLSPLCRSAASHLESHNAPLGASPYQCDDVPSVPVQVDMGFSPAIERFRSGSAHPARDVSTAVPRAGDWSALVISSSST